MNALDVRLSKRFTTRRHEFTVELSFTIPAGVSVLFGPSGSGKTTILECIAGLLTPDSGQISINQNGGRTILFDSQSEIDLPVQQRGLGYVFQTLALFPHLTVEENVGYGLQRLSAAERAERIRAILHSFHIPHLAQQLPARISGGERQRVALARSLVTKPRALLLDEPLSALDYETKSKIMDDLLAWNRDHPIPIIYVTHALDEVFALGEKVVVLNGGRIAKEGRPGEVLRAESEALISQLQEAR